MYIIVVGAGDIGTQLIDIATRSQNEVVVIESDPGRADEAADEFDCLVLNDDATNQETLMDAGADRADAIISTTDKDATNIMVMLLAEEIGIPSRVSVVHDPNHMSVFRQIGVNIIENPQRLIAEYLFRAVQRPTVKDFMQLAGDAEVFEITVTDTAPLANMTLMEADQEGMIGEEFLVIAIERKDEIIMPRGDTELHPGDLVTVFSRKGITADVMETFTGDTPSE